MTKRIAINGFGRIGRLALRAAWASPDFEIVHINEIAGDATTAAHLLKFDSQHGTWQPDVTSSNNEIHIDDRSVSYSENMDITATPWSDLGIDIVVDCTGTFKTSSALQPYFDGNIQKVVVSAPVKDGPLNIVMGVNDHLYQNIRTNFRFNYS